MGPYQSQSVISSDILKKIILSAVLLTVAFTSCKKEDSSSSTTSPGTSGPGTTTSGSVTLNGKTYAYGGAGTFFRVTSDKKQLTIGATNLTDGRTEMMLYMLFRDSLAVGTYQIYDEDRSLEANQVGLEISLPIQKAAYAAIETTNGSAIITLKDGNYSIVIPNMQLNVFADTTTVPFSMNLTQK
ncbi:MAG: hypothetical protein EOP52_00860 [Sphingobacteriales bacterium]|nr:MAG: hypothetical protein EOP52_00860 [Sphingobacteriales bacterium]